LGEFLPNIYIKNVCQDCDNRHGRQFEGIILKSGVIDFFRKTHQITSKNTRGNRKNKTCFINKQRIEFEETKLSISGNERSELKQLDDGTLLTASSICVLKHNIQIDEIFIPFFEDVRSTCNFIQQKCANGTDGIVFEFRFKKPYDNLVLEELFRRGIVTRAPYKLENTSENLKPIRIRSTITDTHFQFIASIVLKTMIFLKYPMELLQPLLRFVDKLDLSVVYSRNFKEHESGFDAEDAPDKSKFWHEIEWFINRNSIKIDACLMRHRKVNGMKLELVVQTGDTTDIILPHGQIIAKYLKGPKGEIIVTQSGDVVDLKKFMTS
jgi:hypothetical protein